MSTFADLVSQADEGDSGPFVPLDGIAPKPRLSTEGTGFASVLQQLVADTKPAPPVVVPPPTVVVSRPVVPQRIDEPRPEAPTGPGDVLVIVGDGARSLIAAQEHARQSRLDESAVHLVAPGGLGLGLPASRLIRSAEEARKRRGSWQGKPHPVVVALDAPLGDPAWAARKLEALHATAVWAVVSATTKTADAQRWLEQLPGVEALVVIDAAASGDPRSVLELGLPIATVDGRPADGAQWRR